MAYIFLTPSPVEIRLEKVTGSWNDINTSQSETPVTEKVFLPVLQHKAGQGSDNTGYVLTSCAGEAQAKTLAGRPSWKVLRNDRDCQAVRFNDGTVMCAFYIKGDLVISKTKTLTAEKPCLMLLSGGRLYTSSPADPL
jgi:chondroitin AC lyase